MNKYFHACLTIFKCVPIFRTISYLSISNIDYRWVAWIYWSIKLRSNYIWFLTIFFLDWPTLTTFLFKSTTAIAAAVFGVPAAPYVIPCTILRRIRLFRENFLPTSTGTTPSRGLSEIIKNHKLLIGNFILSKIHKRSLNFWWLLTHLI